jgi:predicted metal-binding protein
MNDHTLQVDKTKLGIDELVQIALQIGSGIISVAVISSGDISIEDDLADLCRKPKCAFYGLSANCPPYVSGPSGFRAMLGIRRSALAIKIDVPSGWLVTDERLVIMRLLHEIVADIERSAIKLGYSNAMAFAAGSCKEIFCNSHPSCRMLTNKGECRNPQYARPAIEAYGINIHELNKTAGWFINQASNAANTDQESSSPICGLVLIG